MAMAVAVAVRTHVPTRTLQAAKTQAQAGHGDVHIQSLLTAL